jgi:acyl carrier protein
MTLDALPLTASGKTDRNALPPPDLTQRDTGQDHVAPTTTLEREIADIWTDVLGTDHIGLHDDFFDLGGHSMMVMRLAAKLRETYGVEMSLTTLFEHPTVAEQAEAVTDARQLETTNAR